MNNNIRKAIYPGTFDPITNGHVGILTRAAKLFEQVIISVVKTPSKLPLFSAQERIDLVKEATKSISNVEVKGFDGLVVDFARSQQVEVLIRGLRMISDFEYEFQMALTNRQLSQDIETIFFMPEVEYSYISSRLIKEAFFLGADLKKFLPDSVIDALKRKSNEN